MRASDLIQYTESAKAVPRRMLIDLDGLSNAIVQRAARGVDGEDITVSIGGLALRITGKRVRGYWLVTKIERVAQAAEGASSWRRRRGGYGR